MKGWALLKVTVDWLATLLMFIAIAWFVLSRPVIRLWRLACLRAFVDGLVPSSTQFDGPVHSSGSVRMKLGEHCRLGRAIFLETCGGEITLGRNVRINTGCFLVSYSSLTIGDDCLIGEYVSIRDADHGTESAAPMRIQPHVSAPIVIGSNVWIGRGAVILKGVTIGNGAIVAANSVVNRDVLPNAIVGGVPARLLKMRTNQEARIVSHLDHTDIDR